MCSVHRYKYKMGQYPYTGYVEWGNIWLSYRNGRGPHVFKYTDIHYLFGQWSDIQVKVRGWGVCPVYALTRYTHITGMVSRPVHRQGTEVV